MLARVEVRMIHRATFAPLDALGTQVESSVRVNLSADSATNQETMSRLIQMGDIAGGLATL